MNVFLSIKYHPDHRNRERIEQILEVIKSSGAQACCVIRDIEMWGQVHFEPVELMRITFREIRKAHLLMVDLTEKGVGLGIETGYACARGIPVMTIAQTGSDISTTLRGVSSDVLLYDNPKEIRPVLNQILNQQSPRSHSLV